jgi:hypothetical protein
MSQIVFNWQIELKGIPGCDPGALDGVFGAKTATATWHAFVDKKATPYHPAYIAMREELAASIPLQSTRAAEIAGVIKDDPTRPGFLVWTDGKDWVLNNLRSFELPFFGKVVLSKETGPRAILAWAEIECLTHYVPGATSTYCARRMNRNSKSPPSTHTTGDAEDVDFDRDKKWERYEDIDDPRFAEDLKLAFAILRSHGAVLGEDWSGKSHDGMHVQWVRVG